MTYLRFGRIRWRIGATVSLPYLVCAAVMRALTWVVSRTGDSAGGSERILDMSFVIWLGDKSAWSKDGLWQSDARAFSKSTRMILVAWFASSLRVCTEMIEDARTRRSSGRRPIRSANRTRSNCLNISPSPLSIPSRKRSARNGSRASRCVS